MTSCKGLFFMYLKKDPWRVEDHGPLEKGAVFVRKAVFIKRSQ